MIAAWIRSLGLIEAFLVLLSVRFMWTQVHPGESSRLAQYPLGMYILKRSGLNRGIEINKIKQINESRAEGSATAEHSQLLFQKSVSEYNIANRSDFHFMELALLFITLGMLSYRPLFVVGSVFADLVTTRIHYVVSRSL